MKRRILMGSVVAIGFSILAYGTSAYFTAEEQAHNVITTGNIDIELIEMSDPDGDGKDLLPFEDVDGVLPGMDVSKIVTLKNTGGQPAYVRIMLTQSITLADGSTDNVDLSLVSCDINTEDWTEKDGYYYYNEPLEADKETEPLFTTVSFSEEIGNLYQSSKTELSIQAHATQVANNGDSALTANGWPSN